MNKRPPKRVPEEDRLKDTVQKLKSMVRQLRKENKQLHQEMDRLREVIDVEEVKQERREKIVEKKSPSCEKCGSTDLDIIEYGVYILVACNSCGLRNKERIDDK